MLIIWFVLSLISSCLWLGYAVLYTHSRLGGNDFTSLDVGSAAAYVGLIVVPVWVIWQVFGMAASFKYARKNDKKMIKLLEQGKKNQDYTDLVVRVMLEAEHEIKDGFVLNKFDVFVADLNELLADILLRSNAVSSLQLEQLWQRVKNGERWVLAKSLVEFQKRQTNFAAYLNEKTQKDSVFKGTLFEFCARYQDLCALLEKHDRDRVFISIIETGVLGKVYSFLAPLSDEAFTPEPPVNEIMAEEEKDFSESILNMPEPQIPTSQSFWSKINPFGKNKEEQKENVNQEESDDEFFSKLQKNLNEPSQDTMTQETEPRFDSFEPTPEEAQKPEEEKYMPAPEIKETPLVDDQPRKQEDQDNFAYPFGGWINDKN